MMKESNIDRVLYVTSSSSSKSSARNSFKISGRLKLLCSQNWKYASREASMIRARLTVIEALNYRIKTTEGWKNNIRINIFFKACLALHVP